MLGCTHTKRGGEKIAPPTTIPHNWIVLEVDLGESEREPETLVMQ